MDSKPKKRHRKQLSRVLQYIFIGIVMSTICVSFISCGRDEEGGSSLNSAESSLEGVIELPDVNL